MKAVIRVFILFFLFTGIQHGRAQVVSVTNPANTTPALAATYTSLANAITALNGITSISGPVIITLNAGNPQTAPVGGYSINFTAATTAVNNITIEGSSNVITANGSLVSGVYTDAIFKLIGVDYITLRNFVMQENAANANTTPATNNMTEWGVALLHSTPTNGAQFNTIQNNTISLNRNYQNTFGLYANARHSATLVSSADDITNGTTGPNHGNRFYGNTVSNVNHGMALVGSPTDAFMDVGNEIGGTTPASGNSFSNWGSSAIASPTFFSASGTIFCIFSNHQKDDRIGYNNMSSAVITGSASVTIRGIYKRYVSGLPTGTFSSNIVNNSITITNGNTGGGACLGIDNVDISTAAPSASINISDNQILNVSMPATGANFTGIANTDQVGIININNNVLRGTTMAGTGNFTGISNTGAVVTTLNINNNQIGNASGNAVTFSSSTGNTVSGITVPTVANTASVSISGNNFQGFVHNNVAGGVANHTYINLVYPAATSSTVNINNNTFTNLSVNSSGNVFFITRSGTMASAAGATENCSNNSITGSFSKTLSGGTVTLYNATSGSFSGNSMVQTGNNFSNITLTGTTIMAGWNNTEGNGASGGPTKTITGNVFSNWSCGSGNITVINQNNASTGTSVSGNTISNISGSGNITGINYGATNRGTTHTVTNNSITGLASSAGIVNGFIGGSSSISGLEISGNTIGSMSSNASTTTAGISINACAGLTFYRNKISDITVNSATGILYGVSVVPTAAGTSNIYNNLIGDLKAPNGSVDNQVVGMRLSTVATFTSYLVYYNTIHLNASSVNSGLGTTALSATSSATATTGNLTLRNNILINNSIPNGTGLMAVYRRNANILTNFNTASNNNILYGGTPASNRVIFSDGTNTDQTLTAYKTRVGPAREAASFTELTPFLSTTGLGAGFLHIDPSAPTQAESGAANITGYTDDYDSNIRQGNTGYTGTGTAPDIGADELEGIFTELVPPVITYTTLSTPTCSNADQTIAGVTITDNYFGVPTSGANRPRIYYRKNAGTWFSQPGTLTSGSGTNGTWSFTIVVADMGGVSGGDIVSYYIIAQDQAPVPNVAANPSTGLVASGVNSVTTHPTSPATYLLNYTLGGTYTVGSGGDFSTLTAAVSAYNSACALTGPVVFELTDATYTIPAETFPITINNHADASAVNTLTIRPSATATPLINAQAISGIVLSGARYVRIDGRQGGTGSTRSLTIDNLQVGSITLQFINDAVENQIRYCNLRGNSTSAANGGVIAFGAALPTGSGNDNNTVEFNEIYDGTVTPANAIISVGTAGRENSGNSILNNLIHDYFVSNNRSCGIYIATNSTDWTITGNRIYQTVVRNKTTSTDHYGLFVNTGNGYTINNNTIGFADENGNGKTLITGVSSGLPGFPASYTAAGSNAVRFLGIACSFTAGGNTSVVQGNTVGGVALYTSSSNATTFGIWCGVYLESGNAIISDNVVGAASGTGSVYVTTSGNGGLVVGIRAGSAGFANIYNNQVGAIDASGSSSVTAPSLTAISIGGSGNIQVYNNTLGNSTPQNMRQGYFINGADLSSTGTNTAVFSASALTMINSTVSGNISRLSNNILQGWETSCTSATVTAISSSGIMSGANPTLNIDSNHIGTASAGLLIYRTANSGLFYGISHSSSLTASSQSFCHNSITGITYASASANTGSHFMIGVNNSFTGSTSCRISRNTFQDLNLQANGNLYLLYCNFPMTASGRTYIDSNQISGVFTNTPTSFNNNYLVYAASGSSTGGEFSCTGNNFSHVTITGTSAFKGLYSQDPIRKIINRNIFNDFSIGSTSSVNIVELVGNTAANTTISGNTFSNITTAAASLTAIYNNSNAGAGFRADSNQLFQLSASDLTGIHILGNNIQPVQVRGNRFYGFTGTASGHAVRAVRVTCSGPSATTLSYNRMYDLSVTDPGAYLSGISLLATSPVRVVNNLIGDIKAPNASSALTFPIIAGIREEGGANSPLLEIFYNTIHLSGTGTGSNFSAANLYLFTNSIVTLRNNILNNLAIPGSAARSVALWYGGTNINNYQPSSNNNLFYAGVPSLQNLIFYDGTNSDQTITAFQARVSPRDDKSISVEPQFISTNGADDTFLHLSPGNNCRISGAGDNTGILLADDYDGDPRMVTDPYITDIGADEATKLVYWTGANGTAWSDAANWSNGTVPNSDQVLVSITSGPVNQPVISVGETFQVGSVHIGTGATLFNLGTLKVSGSQIVSASGINTVQAGTVEGSMEYNGNCTSAQSISGLAFSNRSVKNLTVSNDLSISPAAGEEVKVAGTLQFGAVSGKTLATGDNIVLLSSAGATAGLGDVTGNSISGSMTVERFINTGTTGGAHPKTWQFLAAPTSGQSIYDAWQEGGSNAPGYGTWITGTGSGFDATTSLPALKYYLPSSNTWQGETSTANPVNNGIGYMLFVRGDRTVTTVNGNPVPTILRSKGTVYQPNNPPPVATVGAGQAASVANPYPSAISIEYMRDNGLLLNLNNDVVVWDPMLSGTYGYGGYQTLSSVNNYEPTAGGTSYYPSGLPSPLVQSGQAFFVRSSGPAGSVTFSEACKVNGSRLVHRPPAPNVNRSFFRLTLRHADGTVADGNAVVYDPGLNNRLDANDAVKMMNTGENIGIQSGGILLSVEARKNIQRHDTVFYAMSNLRKQTYTLAFAPKNIRERSLEAWLFDRFTRKETRISLSDSSFISFTVDNNPASGRPDRFFVVFRKKRNPVNLLTAASKRETDIIRTGQDIFVYPNPVVDRTIRIHISNPDPEKYQLACYDANGRQTGSRTYDFPGGVVEFSLDGIAPLASGIYFIVIRDAAGNEKRLRAVIP